MKLLTISAFMLSAVAALTVALPVNAQTGVDLHAVDKSADPCTNFYRYACGGWDRNNPLPSDQARWNRFNELATHNQEIERKILEQVPYRTATRRNVNPVFRIEQYARAQRDTARLRRDQPRDTVQQRAFPGAGRSKQNCNAGSCFELGRERESLPQRLADAN